jgi:hypothetical protein
MTGVSDSSYKKCYNLDMNIEDFQTAGAWYRKMKLDGFAVPLALYHTLIKIMKDDRVSFQEAYKQLQAEGRVKEINKTIIFKL